MDAFPVGEIIKMQAFSRTSCASRKKPLIFYFIPLAWPTLSFLLAQHSCSCWKKENVKQAGKTGLVTRELSPTKPLSCPYLCVCNEKKYIHFYWTSVNTK